MDGLPTTRIGGIMISKIVCGTNPFFGFSHFTRARDLWMREYFTDSRIKDVMTRACELGVNAVISGVQDRLHAILGDLRREGLEMHWICTPGGNNAKEVEEGVLWCKEHDVEICMPHQMYTDNNLLPAQNDLLGYDGIAEKIRSLGMVPGLSTHRPETIVTMDRAGKDVETYALPLNPIGFLCPFEVEWVQRIVCNSPKPVITIKTMAAGRITPEIGLPFALRAVKGADPLALGFSSVQEVEEDLQLVRSVLSGRPEQMPLTTSRSKAVLGG